MRLEKPLSNAKQQCKQKEKELGMKDKDLCNLLIKWWQWGTQNGSGYETEPIDSYKDVWESMNYTGLGKGSLKLWAKEDNPNLYNTIVANDLHNYFMKTTGKKGGTSFDVANLMYQCYKDDFMCVSILLSYGIIWL